MITSPTVGSGTLKSGYIIGQGGNVANLLLTSNPISPVYADGITNYVLHVRAMDSHGNPVGNSTVSVDIDNEYNYSYPTSSRLDVRELRSLILRPGLAVNVTANGGAVTNSTVLKYIGGDPAILDLVANPQVVADALTFRQCLDRMMFIRQTLLPPLPISGDIRSPGTGKYNVVKLFVG